MEWTEVYGSSNVQAIAYDDKNQDCYVKFHPDGVVYVYSGVGRGVWNELVHAPSKGRFVQIQLRRGYPARRIGYDEIGSSGPSTEGSEE